MKKRIIALLLVFVVISMFVGFSYVSAEVVSEDGQPPSPDDTSEPIPTPLPEEPGAIPDLIGGRVPDRPRVYSQPSPDKIAEPAAPAIDIWYDSPQKFGNIGNSQEWINILGNVTDIDSNDTLTYKLNNTGPDKPLTIGPNGTRLADAGDFNIEIAYDDLNPGNNDVVITASDGISPTQKTVTVNYTTGQTWPSDYNAVWDSSADIQDITQVVDGNWQLSGDSVLIDADNWGYDRLLAIGDEKWTDYEVTVPITVYGLDPAGNQGVSNGSAVGFIMRWLGHTNKAEEQPNVDWSRSGALGWYRWAPDQTEALELRNRQTQIGKNFNKVLEFDTTYIFKMSVQSVPDKPSYYRLKFWKASEDEPFDWDVQGFTNELASNAGSLLLVAHHVDAKFGKVTVKDLETLRLNVNVTVDGQGITTFTPDQEDFGYSERVLVKAFPDFGYDFAGWSGDYVGTGNPAEFLIHRDMNITARFTAKLPTTLSVNTVGGGTVTRDPNRSEYPWGEVVELTAVPASDRIFLRWEGDVTGIKNPESIKMDAHKSVTAVFGDKLDASPKSDDFSQCELNTRLWTVINPAGDASVSVTGTSARFTIPAGTTHDMWQTNSDALRIMQPTNDLNFEIEAKFVNLPSERYQMEGILIQQDDDNWLRFDTYHDGSNLKINAAKNIDGSTSVLRSLAVSSGGETNVYTRVERNGDRWTHSYSFNGTDWTVFVSPIYEMEVTSSGLFVGNAGQEGTQPSFDARVDYFFNTATRIDPEDQGNTVNVKVSGQGQVQVLPLKETYECGEKVTLTATPAPDWLFAGWRGDLTGGANPATITIQGDYEIRANFSQGSTVFLPSIMKKN